VDYVCVCCVDSRVFSSEFGCTTKQDSCTYCCDTLSESGDIVTPEDCSELAKDEVDAKGNNLNLLCSPQEGSTGEPLFYSYYPWQPNKEPPYDSVDPLVVNEKFDENKASQEDGGASWVPPMCASGAWSLTQSTGLRWSTTAVLVCAMSQLLLWHVL